MNGKPTSETFSACRNLVHDDAFEAQIALHMVTPLLKNALNELKLDYLRTSHCAPTIRRRSALAAFGGRKHESKHVDAQGPSRAPA